MTVAAVYRRKQRVREDVKQFQSLIDSPANLGLVAAASSSSALELPANARLAISHSVAINAGDLSLSIGQNRSLGVPALGANVPYNPGVAGEEGFDIVVNRSGALAGTCTVYIMDGIGRLRPIATATFT